MSDMQAKVIAEIQSLEPDAPIELYQLDTSIFGGGLYLFHPHRIQSPGVLLHGGLSYNAIAMEATGFALNGTEQFPTPTIKISNLNGIITSLLEQYDDLVGASVRRIRTIRKYLDDGSEPDPTARISDDTFLINRKTSEANNEVEWELGSSVDVEGVRLPLRRILSRCQAARFKDGINCPYVGEDLTCGRTVADCTAKFPGQELPFMGFPAVERIQLNL